jgi:hypothetical protein
MTEKKGKYKVQNNWGGKRIAGEGKKIGKPAEIGEGGSRSEVYLDKETRDVIAEMIKRKVSKNRSDAIRLLARKYKEQTL